MFGLLELMKVSVTSAGSKMTPLMVSELKTDGVTPPASPSTAAKSSATAKIIPDGI